MIPLFDPNYLASPNAGGLVSNATVNLLVQQGQETTRRLEISSLRNEAAAKAPIMAQLYENAYSQILQGNMGGFSHLAKADAFSAGNPFLAAMTQDASRAATNIAQSYLQTELQKASFAQQEKLQTERIKGQKELQASGIQGQINTSRDIEGRQRRLAAENDHRDANIKIDQLEVEDNAKWNIEVKEAERKIELGEEGVVIPPRPPKRPRPKAPVVTDIQGDLPQGQKELPGDLGLFNTSDNILAQTPPASPVGTPPSEPTNESKKTQVPGVPGVPGVAEDEAAARSKIKIIEPPGAKPKTVERKYGELVFTLPAYNESAPVSKIEKVGDTTYQFDKEPPPAKKLAGALARIQGADPLFAEGSANMIVQGNRVVVRTETDANKKTIYVPYAVKPDGSEEAFGKIGPDKTPTGEKQTISKEVYQDFRTVQGLMEGEMRGKIKMKIPISEPAKVKVRESAIARIANKELTLEDANRQLILMEAKPITKQEVAAYLTVGY